MKKTIFLCGLFTLALGCKQAPAPVDVALIQEAQKIHLKTLTLDTHDDINVANFTDSLNYRQDTDTQVNIPKMQQGALDVAWFIVYTGQGELNEAGYEKAAKNAQEKFDAIHRLTDIYAPDRMALATSAEEVRNVRRTGRKVAMIGVENAYSLGLDTANVKKFYDQGARYMSLAHNGHSQFADSNTGEIDGVFLHNGLSPLGKLVIEKMNYYGIMLDISHPSKEANRQAIIHSKAPVIASHSSARGLSDHPRNLDDEQLEWVKASGGVVQTVALALYVNKEKHLAHQEAKNAVLTKKAEEMGMTLLSRRDRYVLTGEAKTTYNQQYKELLENAAEELKKVNAEFPPVDVADFVDHIDYIKNKIGVDYVGISSDFDGGGGIEGWKDASETFNVTLELVRRGYSQEEIEKIWSGNLLRVLDAVAAKAKELQAN